jgi:hypothetical protein
MRAPRSKSQRPDISVAGRFACIEAMIRPAPFDQSLERGLIGSKRSNAPPQMGT